MTSVHIKAVCIEVFAKGFKIDGIAAFGLENIIELDVDDGESIKIFILILKRKLFAADALKCFFKFFAVQRIVQKNFK